VDAFTIPVGRKMLKQSSGQSHHHMLPDSSSLLTAVEVFDGSTIVDPVVVSGVFWASLKGKLLAFFFGQILATAAFGIISSLIASQLYQAGNFVTKSFFSSSMNAAATEEKKKTFIKADAASKPDPDFGKLFICLAIDVIGSSSELIPILGEATDVVYAPIAATILRSLYGSNILFALEFGEEILPFTDILPLATICWVVDTYFGDSDIAKLLQLGDSNPTRWAEDAIDAKAESNKKR